MTENSGEIAFQGALHNWAKGIVGDVPIVSVEISASEAHAYSSYTMEDASFTVQIRYGDHGGRQEVRTVTNGLDESATTLGELLTAILVDEAARAKR